MKMANVDPLYLPFHLRDALPIVSSKIILSFKQCSAIVMGTYLKYLYFMSEGGMRWRRVMSVRQILLPND